MVKRQKSEELRRAVEEIENKVRELETRTHLQAEALKKLLEHSSLSSKERTLLSFQVDELDKTAHERNEKEKEALYVYIETVENLIQQQNALYAERLRELGEDW